MNTLEYLDEVKKTLGLPSDYAVAKRLGIRHSTICGYRKRGGQMDDDVARRVGEVLGVHPGLVMLDIQRERAGSEELSELWTEIYEGFQPPLPHADSGRGVPSPSWR